MDRTLNSLDRPTPHNEELLDAYSRAVMGTLDRTRGGVVALKMHARRGSRRLEGAGSGFLITPDGYLLTNSHVVHGGRELRVPQLRDRVVSPSPCRVQDHHVVDETRTDEQYLR